MWNESIIGMKQKKRFDQANRKYYIKGTLCNEEAKAGYIQIGIIVNDYEWKIYLIHSVSDYDL